MLLHVVEEVADRLLGEVVEVRPLLEPGEQALRIEVGPVAEHDHVIAVIGEGLGFQRLDHQWPVETGLLLEAGMAVVPVGAALHDVEAVLVGLATVDAVEAQPGHAVHVGRQQDAVPVDRRLLAMDRAAGQGIADPQVDGGAFPPAQQGCGNRSVDCDRGACGAGEVHRRLADGQVELGARKYVGHAFSLDGPAGARPEAKRRGGASGGKSLNKEAARRGRQPSGTAERIG